VLTTTRKRLFRRPRLWTTLVAVLAAVALVGGLLQDAARAPAAALPKASVSTICRQSVNSAEVSLLDRAPAVTTGPRAQSASYTIPRSALDAERPEAVSDCESQLDKSNAKTAAWGYLPSRMAEIGVTFAVTFFATTTICYYSPANCSNGIKIGSFLGGFFGSLMFQWMNTGTLDWKAAGYALLDAFVDMLAFTGLENLGNAYTGVEGGVAQVFNNIGEAITGAMANFAGLGGDAITYVQETAAWIWNNVLTTDPNYFWGTVGAAYHGGGSFESVLSSGSGEYIATGLQLRDIGYDGDNDTSTDDVWDLHSGTPGGTSYYDWDIEQIPGAPADANDNDIAYEIAQGDNCLESAGYNGASVYLGACNTSNQQEYWYIDGAEISSSSGLCINEVPSTGRWLTSCDATNYQDYPPTKDDDFMVTTDGGDPIPDSYSDWANDLSVYENS
jgi:hypothetical protein